MSLSRQTTNMRSPRSKDRKPKKVLTTSPSKPPPLYGRLDKVKSWDDFPNPYDAGTGDLPVVVTRRRDALTPKMARKDMCKYSERSPMAKAKAGNISIFRVLSYELQASIERREVVELDLAKIYKMKPDAVEDDKKEGGRKKKGLGVFRRMRSAPAAKTAKTKESFRNDAC